MICKQCGIEFEMPVVGRQSLILCSNCKDENRRNKNILRKRYVDDHTIFIERLYSKTPHYKLYQKNYWNSLKGKAIQSKIKDYRKRNLSSELLNDWFKGCERHHINNKQIICIPKELHKQYYHNHKKSETMKEINKLAFEYLLNTIKQL